MKKLCMIITLFVSSFFLFNSDVKAYEYEREVDFSLIGDVLSLKEKLDSYIELDTTYSDYYFIYLDNDFSIKYYLLRLSESPDNFIYVSNSSQLGLRYPSSLKFGYNLTKIDLVGGISNGLFLMYNGSSNCIILYSNFDLYLTTDLNSIITYKYGDFQIINDLSLNNKFMTLYDIYFEYQIYLGNKELVHQEEIQKVGNFYTVVIDRISYLVKEMSSNYIYLSIFVIFIFIFVVELIRRRCI